MMKTIISAALLTLSTAAVGHDDGPDLHGWMPDWMAGAWEHVDGANWADEYWTGPRGGMMIGASRSGEGEKLQFFEHMRIQQEEGGLVFWAITDDQKPVRFVEAKRLRTEIIFENAAHDYPQRIHYWRDGKDLKARISLIDGSKAMDFSWRMMGSP